MSKAIGRIGVSDSMTLKEITDLLDVRHDKAMVIVAKMATDPEFKEVSKIDTSYTNNIGAKLPLQTYQLDKRQSIAVAARLNTGLLMRVIDRWQALEIENEQLRATEVKRVEDRLKARLGSLPLTNAVKELREEEGKATKFFHYSNEYDMINRIVLGMTAKKFREEHDIQELDAIRDCMSSVQVEGVEVLQSHNTVLIEVGMNFKDRKIALIKKWCKLLDKQLKLK